MSETFEVSGQCLCGAVRLTARVARPVVDACHCNMCRRWSGGPMMAVEADGEVAFEDEGKVAVHASSDWAERGFCRQCGTHLFYRLKEHIHYALPVGLLETGPSWVFETEIFVDEKPEFYDFANDTRRMTGKEVFEQFGQS